MQEETFYAVSSIAESLGFLRNGDRSVTAVYERHNQEAGDAKEGEIHVIALRVATPEPIPAFYVL